MPRLTFYPVGNADTFVIDLVGGEKIVFDYANRRNPDDKEDKCCDLPVELRKDGTEHQNRAGFEREGGASWSGRGRVDRWARTPAPLGARFKARSTVVPAVVA